MNNCPKCGNYTWFDGTTDKYFCPTYGCGWSEHKYHNTTSVILNNPCADVVQEDTSRPFVGRIADDYDAIYKRMKEISKSKIF